MGLRSTMAMRFSCRQLMSGGEIEADGQELAVVGVESFLRGLPAIQQIVELERAVEGDLAHGETDEARAAQDQRLGPRELHDVLVLGRDLGERRLVIDHPLDLVPVSGEMCRRGGGMVDLGDETPACPRWRISPRRRPICRWRRASRAPSAAPARRAARCDQACVRRRTRANRSSRSPLRGQRRAAASCRRRRSRRPAGSPEDCAALRCRSAPRPRADRRRRDR